MGDLSEIGRTERRELVIAIPPHWADHRFQGRTILPAVEAMQLLAQQAARSHPAADVHTMKAVRFDKFLPLPPDRTEITAFCDLTPLEDDRLRAALATRVTAKTTTISRTVVHARVDFPYQPATPSNRSPEPVVVSGKEVFQVAPDRIYAELVPFGVAYRNIVRPLQLTRDGALATLRAPHLVDEQTASPLGSPFIADAAFHAACVWSQRYAGVVAFPVGIDRRIIRRPTQTGATCLAWIVPKETASTTLRFDIGISAPDGWLHEELYGVQMRDVSGGRLEPPDWIRSAETEGQEK